MCSGSDLVRVCFVSAVLSGRAHHVGARGQVKTERVEQKERITWSKQGVQGCSLTRDKGCIWVLSFNQTKTEFVPVDVDPPV